MRISDWSSDVCSSDLGGDAADALGADGAARGLHPLDAAVAVLQETGDLAALDDVDAEGVGGAGIAPGDGVVPRGAAAALDEAAHDRPADAGVGVDDRHQLLATIGKGSCGERVWRSG